MLQLVPENVQPILQGNWILFLLLTLLSCHSSQKTASTPLPEAHRPLFHFTPPAMWMNDPNGMVYYEGEYHLSYQYYPDATVWGPMHWGHAVSKDLVHWEHLPVALYPDSLGMIFSGSAVVDWNNTSGFGKNGKPPLVAIFTQHLMEGEKAGRSDFQYQSIAYSNDKGHTWTKYAGNPVLPNTQKIKDFRDPKVIWDRQSKQWIMALAVQDHVKLWASADLINWKHLSDFGKKLGAHGGVWECPDFFPMQVEGSQETRWVLLLSINPGAPNGGSGTQYFVGNFDGKTFSPDPAFESTVLNGQGQWLDWGCDDYAGVTWSDVPEKDGRRIFIGWMSNWNYATTVPTEKWRSALTLPRKLSLVRENAQWRLVSAPVEETRKLRKKTFSLPETSLTTTLDLGARYPISPSSMEMEFDVDIPPGSRSRFSIELSNAKGEKYVVGYDAGEKRFFSDRTHSGKTDFPKNFASAIHTAPRISTGNTVHFHLFFDVASCELFADQGSVVMTNIFFPTENFNTLKLLNTTGSLKILNGKMYAL